MRGTFRLARIMGIDIDIHVTFFLLLMFFFLILGPKGLVLIVGVFIFVTIHELCHSLVAAHFGIRVRHITLLPIGGIAEMPEIPANPRQEFLISIAGPLSNIAVLIIFYYPLLALLGGDTLMYPLKVMTGQAAYKGSFNVLAHIYWINLVLAVFNLLPAFPMDGGRVLRAALSSRMSYRDATVVAVRLGHIFALFFGYIGVVHGQIFLLVIAVFIYMAASGEGMQVAVRETIRNYSVKDILADTFASVRPDTTLKQVLELMFHRHQEDFPVVEDGGLKGIITRKEIMLAAHQKGKEVTAEEVMRTDVPSVNDTERLDVVQKLMVKYGTNAMPVEKDGRITGVVTLDDINKVYIMMSET